MNDFLLKYYTSKLFWDDLSPMTISCAPVGFTRVMTCQFLPAGSVLFRTSGSSGLKKWVVHTRRTLLAGAKLVVRHLGITSSDRWLLALPLEHVGGFGILARSYYSGCKVIPLMGKWNALEAVKSIAEKNISVCSFVPTQVVDIVQCGMRCPNSVRAVIVGGGKLDEEVKRRGVELGWPILESYGMTETGSQIATQHSVEDGQWISLIDGWQVKENDNGELQVRGAGLMKGYVTSSDSGIEFCNRIGEGEWFKTTDKVRVDTERGRLYFIGRNDRKVKILGELVDLEDLEANLSRLVKAQIVVVDVADSRRGVLLVPVVEAKSAVRLDRNLLSLSGLYRLEELEVCDVFPRNAMGKLNLSELREWVVFSRNVR